MSRELEKVVENIKSKYRPEGNTHTPMWEGRYIGGSSIVAKTAGQIARHILKREVEDVDKKWGFLGNTIGDAAFEDIPHKEIRFELDLEGGWKLAGHCDGIKATAEGIIVLEHKYFLKNEVEKQEKATRQAMLYLAMGARKVAQEGDQTFPVADYSEGPSFKWRKDQKPLGVVTAIAPSHIQDGTVVARELDWEACEELLKFYEMKASYIIKAVEAGDPKFADMWDEGPYGLQEFSESSVADIQTDYPDDELQEAIRQYAILQKQRTSADRQIKLIKPKIDAAMKTRDVNDLACGEFYVHRTYVPPQEVSYTRGGYSRLTIKQAQNPENWVKTGGKNPTKKRMKKARSHEARREELGY